MKSRQESAEQLVARAVAETREAQPSEEHVSASATRVLDRLREKAPRTGLPHASAFGASSPRDLGWLTPAIVGGVIVALFVAGEMVFFRKVEQRRNAPSQTRVDSVPAAPQSGPQPIQTTPITTAPIETAPIATAPVQNAPIQNSPDAPPKEGAASGLRAGSAFTPGSIQLPSETPSPNPERPPRPPASQPVDTSCAKAYEDQIKRSPNDARLYYELGLCLYTQVRNANDLAIAANSQHIAFIQECNRILACDSIENTAKIRQLRAKETDLRRNFEDLRDEAISAFATAVAIGEPEIPDARMQLEKLKGTIRR
jgi:hypothetical protein